MGNKSHTHMTYIPRSTPNSKALVVTTPRRLPPNNLKEEEKFAKEENVRYGVCVCVCVCHLFVRKKKKTNLPILNFSSVVGRVSPPIACDAIE